MGSMTVHSSDDRVDLADAVARIEAAGLVAVPAREGRRQRRSRTADTNDRRTPRWLVERAAERFGGFVLDAAATEANTCRPLWLGPGSLISADALAVAWTWETLRTAAGRLEPWLSEWIEREIARDVPLSVWCNPPYGPPGTLAKWVAHIRRQRDEHGTRTTLLGPGDHSVGWLRECIRDGEIVEDLPYRVAFDAPDGSTHNAHGRPNAALGASVIVHFATTWGKAVRA